MIPPASSGSAPKTQDTADVCAVERLLTTNGECVTPSIVDEDQQKLARALFDKLTINEGLSRWSQPPTVGHRYRFGRTDVNGAGSGDYDGPPGLALQSDYPLWIHQKQQQQSQLHRQQQLIQQQAHRLADNARRSYTTVTPYFGKHLEERLNSNESSFDDDSTFPKLDRSSLQCWRDADNAFHSVSETPFYYQSGPLSPGDAIESLYSPPRGVKRPDIGNSAQSRITHMHPDVLVLCRRKMGDSALPRLTWKGVLPRMHHQEESYASKVFLGGIPAAVTDRRLVDTFSKFGLLGLERPARSSRNKTTPGRKINRIGYAYLVLDNEDSVRSLIRECDQVVREHFFRLEDNPERQVQVIPWILSDSVFRMDARPVLRETRVVFVGGLHGMITAVALARIMDDLFGGVISAVIEVDQYQYPRGYGRVTFDNDNSFYSSLEAGFVQVQTVKFSKKIQIEPYLEESVCTRCCFAVGTYFCPDLGCFSYFCDACWMQDHGFGVKRQHMPVTRQAKGSGSPLCQLFRG